MAAKTAFKKKCLCFGRTLEPAFIVASCCIKGTFKYELGKNETGSRGRVKMRNGVGEATGGTWPTYSSGGGRRRGGRLRSGREKEKEKVEEEEREGGGDLETQKKARVTQLGRSRGHTRRMVRTETPVK